MSTFYWLSFLRDFLPRGSGIVTRRPLVLQLISANAGGFTHITHPHIPVWTHLHMLMHTNKSTLPLLFFSSGAVFGLAFNPSCTVIIPHSAQPLLISVICSLFSSCQNGLNFSTVKGKSLQTLMKFAKRLKQRLTVSQGPTKAYRLSPSTYGFTPLTVQNYPAFLLLLSSTQ